MVDVSAKAETARTAVAFGRVLVNRSTFDLIRSGGLKKGDVLTTAQIGGIMGAKPTADNLPICHKNPLSASTTKVPAEPGKPDR
ncbi:MAG: cyclic pyranopterin monophosphate synthase MoaC [Oscillospiraceae bacterium]|nr:cyclic pyranopterin monophosphate synthase MoaC [Oscillospiraceae bacterium]